MSEIVASVFAIYLWVGVMHWVMLRPETPREWLGFLLLWLPGYLSESVRDWVTR